MQPIQLTVNINPAVAVRAGKARCGSLTRSITQEEIDGLTEEQREYLAKHLARELEPLNGLVFLHADSLDNGELADWESDTLAKLLDNRKAKHAAFLQKAAERVAVIEENYRSQIARQEKNQYGFFVTIDVRDQLPEDLRAAVNAENDYRNEQNRLMQAQQALVESQRHAEAVAWDDRIRQGIDAETLEQHAAGLLELDGWQLAWETSLFKLLGYGDYEITRDATVLEKLTREQFKAFKGQQQGLRTDLPSTIETLEMKPALLNGEFAVEIHCYTCGKHAYAVKVLPWVGVSDKQRGGTDDDGNDDD